MTRPYLQLTKSISFIIGLFLFISTSVSAENIKLTLEQAKVYYTFSIIDQVIWPNENDFNQFMVGIYSDDQELIKAFQNKQNTTKKRGKSFLFEAIKDNDLQKDKYNLIFIDNRFRYQNEKIFNQMKKALIISDGYVDKKLQMFSLLSKANQIKISLNRSNLSDRGFEVSNELLLLAGTKEELGEQLNEKEMMLVSLMEEVQENEKKLSALNDALQNKTISLNDAISKYEKNKKLLTTSLKEIEQTKLQQNAILKSIEEQNNIIKQKQAEIYLQEESIENYKNSIEQNKLVLQQQIDQIQEQNSTIKSKNNTITEQRNWLAFVLIVSSVFFIMIYFLLRANKLRKHAYKELKSLNIQLHKLATTDSMTKIYNRRYFLETAQNELIRQQRNNYQSAMLMIDIDSFKNINDSYGHIMGDEVIRSIANTLRSNMRQYDLVGRFGGEEFAMMLVDCDIKLATEIAQRICDEIAHTQINYENTSLNVTISTGVSQLTAEDTDVLQTLTRADQALYQAKNSGKNKVVVFS